MDVPNAVYTPIVLTLIGIAIVGTFFFVLVANGARAMREFWQFLRELAPHARKKPPSGAVSPRHPDQGEVPKVLETAGLARIRDVDAVLESAKRHGAKSVTFSRIEKVSVIFDESGTDEDRVQLDFSERIDVTEESGEVSESFAGQVYDLPSSAKDPSDPTESSSTVEVEHGQSQDNGKARASSAGDEASHDP